MKRIHGPSKGRGHDLGGVFRASLRTRLGRLKLRMLRKQRARREKNAANPQPLLRGRRAMGVRMARHLTAWQKFAWKRLPVNSAPARLAGRRHEERNLLRRLLGL